MHLLPGGQLTHPNYPLFTIAEPKELSSTNMKNWRNTTSQLQLLQPVADDGNIANINCQTEISNTRNISDSFGLLLTCGRLELHMAVEKSLVVVNDG